MLKCMSYLPNLYRLAREHEKWSTFINEITDLALFCVGVAIRISVEFYILAALYCSDSTRINVYKISKFINLLIIFIYLFIYVGLHNIYNTFLKHYIIWLLFKRPPEIYNKILLHFPTNYHFRFSKYWLNILWF